MVIIRQFSYYFIGTILASSISFLMLPILTNFLTPHDYGIISSITIIIQMITLFSFGLGSLLVREAQVNLDYTKELLASFFVQIMIIGVILIFLSHFFDSTISKMIFIQEGYLKYIVILSILNLLQGIFFSLLQALTFVKKYAILSIISVLLNMIFSIFLLKYIDPSWKSRLDAMFISTLIVDIYFLYFIYKNNFLHTPSMKGIFEINKFGIPLIPQALAGFIIISVDRFYLANMENISIMGIYSVAIIFMGILRVLVEAINKAILPHMMKKLQNITVSEKLMIVKYIYLYDICILLIAVILTYISKYILVLFIDKEYYYAQNFFIYLFIAMAFVGMYRMRIMFVLYTKMTNKLAYKGNLIAALVSIVLCPILIHINGPIGAAQSMMIAYIISFISVWKLSNEVYPMPWNLRRNS